MEHTAKAEKIRLDKWLWAARFYKTRALATSAVEGGKVKLNNQRTKPAHAVKIGDLLRIVIGTETWQLSVQVLSDQRVSAPIARMRYEETPESSALRLATIAERNALGQTHPHSAPDKRDRRDIQKLKRQPFN